MNSAIHDPFIAAMRERLHQALRSFFSEKYPAGRGAREGVNREQIDQIGNELGIRVVVDNDRKYGQSDRAIFRYIPGQGLVDCPAAGCRQKQIESIQNAGGEIWDLFLLLSDLGPWMSLYGNRYVLDENGRLKLSAPSPDHWPVEVKTAAGHIRALFQQKGWEEPPPLLLDETISLRPDYPVLDTPSTVYTHLFGEV